MTTALVSDLEHIIRLILLYPQGLSILLGEVPPPAASDLVDAFPGKTCGLIGVRARKQPFAESRIEAIDRIDELLRRVGGWAHITKAVAFWKELHPADWALAADHVRSVKPYQRWISGSDLRRMERQYGLSQRTILRKKKLLAHVLASFVLYSPIDRGSG